jgi:hypothetical protein
LDVHRFRVASAVGGAGQPRRLFHSRRRGPYSYLAVNKRGDATASPDTDKTIGGLNHIALVVDDLDAVEARVVGASFATHSHADYEPGRRFYFHDQDNIEYEVVSYK